MAPGIFGQEEQRAADLKWKAGGTIELLKSHRSWQPFTLCNVMLVKQGSRVVCRPMLAAEADCGGCRRCRELQRVVAELLARIAALELQLAATQSRLAAAKC